MTDTVGAFAGVVGYGDDTVGGRGGQVVHVTNLNDSGTGSLRWALETLMGPRIVVFDVGGTINLKSQILIQDGYVTIAGQTAPGDGITIEGARVRVKASEVIIRGMHFRPGDGVEGQVAGDRDGLMIGTTDFTVKNVVIDHNSFAWAVDENLDINGKVQNVTVSNNIIAEGLSNSIHPKGEHSKGMLISNWEGAAGDDANITVVGNLFSDNMQRNPEVRTGQNIEIVNNYIYNYGLSSAGISVGGASKGTMLNTIQVVGNVLTPGASTGKVVAPINIEQSAAGSQIAIADNILTAWATDAMGNQVQSTLYHTYDKKTTLPTITSSTTLGSGLVAADSTKVAALVLANVGAVNGSGRDAIDMRILNEVATGTGIIIDSTVQVTAKAASTKTMSTAAIDTDRDGMTDWFEDLYGFDATKADDKGDNDKDGFTNVEEYINGLITGFDLGKAKVTTTVTALAGKAVALTTTPRFVNGFVAGDNQKLEVANASGSGVTAENFKNYVQIAYANGNSYVTVDADGVGVGQQQKLIAIINNAHVTVNDLSWGNKDADKTATTTAAAMSSSVTMNNAVVVETPHTTALTYLTGTSGDDTYTVRDYATRISEKASAGTDSVVSYVDYALDANVENLSLKGAALIAIGNAFGNKIIGNDLANTLSGLDGNDLLRGGLGNDTLYGGLGDDRIEGNEGDDILWGGMGAETLYGGAGADKFCFVTGDSLATKGSAQDRIVDFDATDCVQIDGKLLDLGSVAQNSSLKASYTTAFSLAQSMMSKSTDVVIINGAKDSWLFWDGNHDGVIDNGVTLTNAVNVLAQLVPNHTGSATLL